MKKVLLLGALALSTLLPASVRAMEFQVYFDISVSKAPDPIPPYVGQGIFGFDGNKPDGSYLFKDLTNVVLSFAFNPNPPIFTNPIYVYNFYGDPTYPDYSNAAPLYDPDNLKVVIYNNSSKFYFDGPSSTTYGNIGSLTLLLYNQYLTDDFPTELTSPTFLSFQPNNPTIPPGGSLPTPPFNNYGAYVTRAGNTAYEQIYNGTYGTVVPGPLPILGTGLTFAYSRRLRKRLRDVKQQALHSVH